MARGRALLLVLLLNLAPTWVVASPLGTLLPAGTFIDVAPPKTIVLKPLNPQRSRSWAVVRVGRGDTLRRLAARYDTTRAEVRAANGLASNRIQLGEWLRVPLYAPAVQSTGPQLPPGARWHTIGRGEVLSSVARRYGLRTLDIVAANPGIPSLDRLRSGTALLIPGQEKGLIWRLKPNQSILEVASYFAVPVARILQANGLRHPNGLGEGDYVLVPGVDPESTLARLEAKRSAEQAAIAKARAKAEAKRLARLAAARKVAAANVAKRKARAQAAAQAVQVRRSNVGGANRSFDPGTGDTYRWPLSGSITSYFGRRGFWIGASNFHTGLDISGGYGSAIRAAKGGEVIEAGYGEFGLNARIATGAGVVNIYGHMSRIRVYAGQRVRRGQIIGYEGCTGICTGSHLHFEVQINGVPRNPLRYLP